MYPKPIKRLVELEDTTYCGELVSKCLVVDRQENNLNSLWWEVECNWCTSVIKTRSDNPNSKGFFHPVYWREHCLQTIRICGSTTQKFALFRCELFLMYCQQAGCSFRIFLSFLLDSSNTIMLSSRYAIRQFLKPILLLVNSIKNNHVSKTQTSQKEKKSSCTSITFDLLSI